VAVGFVRGAVLAFIFEVGAAWLAPGPAGAHVALSAFAAAYAGDRRTVFWRYSVPSLVVYALAVARLLGGGPGLALHALAGLAGWLGARHFPYHRAPPTLSGVIARTGAVGSAPPDSQGRTT
jgi:hypothetical protein